MFPNVKPVVDFDPKSPLPKPTEGADVVAVAVEEPRVPKLSPPVELLKKNTPQQKIKTKSILQAIILFQNNNKKPYPFLSHTIIEFPKPHTM